MTAVARTLQHRAFEIMTANRDWPVEIAPVGPVAVGTVLWRRLGQLRFTVIVKATFGFTPGGVMVQAKPAPLQRREAHHGDNPMRSIRAASDLSPFLGKTDVLFVGHAHAPGGAPTSMLPVRLAILRGQWALLDKSLFVMGDRAAAPAGQPPPEPAPFQRLPIVYERAFGGIGASDNPLGVGAGSNPGDSLPNIVRPERGSREIAGYGPISHYFPARKRLLKGYARKLLEGPIAELPDDLDPSYFQSAPEDQRIDYLQGDEIIALENLHPSCPRLVTRLPGARARARIYTPDGAERHLHLEADTLFIEGDQERASLTFRASHPLTHEHAVSGLSILAGLELPGQPIAWPLSHERRRFYGPVMVAALRPEASAEPTQSTQSTQTLEDADFLATGVEDRPTEALPTDMLASPNPADKSHPWDVTYELNAHEAAAVSLLQAPFAVAAPGSSRAAHAEPIPGAPWAPRKPQDTLVLIDVDAEPARAPLVTADDEILVIEDEDDDDDDKITGAFRAKSAPRPEEPQATSAPRPEEPQATSAPRQEKPEAPEEEDFDERAATVRMTRLRLPPPPQSPISPPAPVPPPRPSAPTFGLVPLAPVPPPRPSAPARGLIPPAPVPPPRPSAPARGLAPSTPAPELAPSAPVPPPRPSAPALGLAPSAQVPPAAPETGLRAEIIARLRARTPLHGLDLAGADLHGIDFTGAALARLDLRGARLAHCIFTEARLTDVNLAGADLTGATLRAADLGGADLSRAVLTEARLDRALLSDTNLSAARGERASFEGATGQRTSFARGEWECCIFAGVELTSPDFAGALLSGASFRGASLIEARFDDARARGASFDGARMPGARAAGAALSGCSFRDIDAAGSSFERATLDTSSFQGGKLKEASFARAICHKASFAAAELASANMQYLQADGADFQGANLEGAELRNAHLHEAIFDGANLKKLRGHKADLSRSRFERADLSDAVLRSARLAGASLKHARLDGASFIETNLEQANVHGASLKTAKMNGANLKGLSDTDTPDLDLQRKEP